jgi:hypothetical protein
MALTMAFVVVLYGCGGDEDTPGGPPTILQTRITVAEDDPTDTPDGRTALLVEAWVDDPNDDIAAVYIASASMSMYAGDAELTAPVDLDFESEERSQGRDTLVNQLWAKTLDIGTPEASDAVEFAIVVEDHEANSASKTATASPSDWVPDGRKASADYMPLTVGNSWRYRDRNTDEAYTNTVTGVREEAGVSWFVISNEWGESLRRKDVFGDVFRRFEFAGEQVYGEGTLDRDRLVGRNWQSRTTFQDPAGNVWVDQVWYRIESTSATVVTPAGTFVCILTQAAGDTEFADGVIETWYADGVGIVRERRVSSTFLPEYDYELVSYRLMD